ncbi:hypothetical protein AG1IA_05550 [Rhizoctonia solani AG-1 IA]|uniref:Oxidoreductase N-terminal domain-containing protein n=1 Tax=Thanatephorus cucumeris (strain AG1-IA) TaxID=983506 RepID=L8WQL0_THACA|nr:hypothetical protein AG1IA_05550 [Rhizoctonia solani AG-1 IA]
MFGSDLFYYIDVTRDLRLAWLNAHFTILPQYTNLIQTDPTHLPTSSLRPMAVPRQTRRIFLSENPQGHITKSTFGSETANLPTPTPDQVIVRTDYLSLDPAMRVWLNDDVTYVPPVRVGETMRGAGVGTVVHGNNQIKTGDVVYGVLGWAEYIIASAQSLRVLHPPEGFTALDYLGPLGTAGMTGLFEVGKLKAGETLVVSAAAGGVGSLVCQIGKIKGAKVIAIASGTKCAWLIIRPVRPCSASLIQGLKSRLQHYQRKHRFLQQSH